jgi:hypothetical protein
MKRLASPALGEFVFLGWQGRFPPITENLNGKTEEKFPSLSN